MKGELRMLRAIERRRPADSEKAAMGCDRLQRDIKHLGERERALYRAADTVEDLKRLEESRHLEEFRNATKRSGSEDDTISDGESDEVCLLCATKDDNGAEMEQARTRLKDCRQGFLDHRDATAAHAEMRLLHDKREGRGSMSEEDSFEDLLIVTKFQYGIRLQANMETLERRMVEERRARNDVQANDGWEELLEEVDQMYEPTSMGAVRMLKGRSASVGEGEGTGDASVTARNGSSD